MKIAIIGFGNIGKAFTSGVLKKGVFAKEDITACDMNLQACEYAKSEFNINATCEINEALANANIVLWAVKGHVFYELAKNIDKKLIKDYTQISFMAGMKIEDIKNATLGQGEIVRGMPTLAMKNNNAIIGYTPTNDKFLVSVFDCLGYAFSIEEGDIEKVTAYSSCGLGFAAYLLEAYKQAGIKMGFDEETCENITSQTFKNAIEMGNYAQTVKDVSTKGGATELGVNYMQNEKLMQIVCDTVRLAYEKFA